MLIGVELLETLKAYVEKEVIHVRVVLEVALIAMACKVIIEEPNTVPSLTLFGDCCTDLCLGYSAFLRAAGKARNRSWDFVRVRQNSMGDNRCFCQQRTGTRSGSRLCFPDGESLI